MKKITLLILMILAFDSSFGQIVSWEMDLNTGDEITDDATTLNTNLNTVTLGRGDGLEASNLDDTFSSDDFSTSSSSKTDAIANNDYLEFQISAASGYEVSLSTLDANFRRSSTGPDSFIWRYSIDGLNFTDIGSSISYTSTATNGTAQTQIDLTGITALQNVDFNSSITLRLYAWGATGLAGSFAIGRLSGDDLSLGGSVNTEGSCSSVTNWNGTNWDNGDPDISTVAVLNADYNTSSSSIGSFSSCSLVVNAGTLTIEDNTFIEVENNLTVNGNIIVNAYGAFVQNDDLSSIIYNGTISVTKETAPMNAWYEYTYWSSPVEDETIEGAIDKSNYYRRFEFDSEKYLDATAETNNDGAEDDGQDDIDDNGDDWKWVDGTTVMQPGIGYAMTLTPTAYNNAPGTDNKQFSFTFEGKFNNGVYTVPVYRNDSEEDDNNWNLIGNPYPSAIDVDLFLAENTEVDDQTDTFPSRAIVGAVYLWSQNTAPSSSTNGSSPINFSNSDYAIINGVTAIPGGDGITPNRYIPSGQAFLVSYSDDATAVSSSPNGDGHTISQGNITFNNSMRVKGATDNSQFFKNSKLKVGSKLDNKLWINLTSDNGIFNQIAIGYVKGATNGNDGSFYDAPKNGSSGAAVSLYSTIEGSNKAFAIQGKSLNSLSIDETINLGFKSNIGVATLFKLSIDHLQGDFLTENTIYLKDNLLNKLHDLSASDYTFITEVGEFNERFEIVFNAASPLSTDDITLNTNKFSIVNLAGDKIQFNTNSNLTIKTISVFDLLGRQVYNLAGTQNSETYDLPRLKNRVYIAKIELSNGLILTKKAIKK